MLRDRSGTGWGEARGPAISAPRAGRGRAGVSPGAACDGACVAAGVTSVEAGAAGWTLDDGCGPGATGAAGAGRRSAMTSMAPPATSTAPARSATSSPRAGAVRGSGTVVDSLPGSEGATSCRRGGGVDSRPGRAARSARRRSSRRSPTTSRTNRPTSGALASMPCAVATSATARAICSVVAKRAAASFSSARATTASNAATSGAASDTSGAGIDRTRSSVSASLCPRNRRLPDRASQSTTPRAKTSALPIDRLAADVLGRHVPGLALERLARRAGVRGVDALRDAEVGDARDAVDADQHVLRRHVAVHEADRLAALVDRLVRGVQAGARVEDDADGDAGRQPLARARPGPHQLAERRALDVVHHELHGVAHGLDVAHVDDVRVVDARGEPRLAQERVAEAVVLEQVRVRPLDGDELPEAERPLQRAEEHRRHPARGDLEDGLVTEVDGGGRGDGESTKSRSARRTTRRRGRPPPSLTLRANGRGAPWPAWPRRGRR